MESGLVFGTMGGMSYGNQGINLRSRELCPPLLSIGASIYIAIKQRFQMVVVWEVAVVGCDYATDAQGVRFVI
jgi:hypothetical protein